MSIKIECPCCKQLVDKKQVTKVLELPINYWITDDELSFEMLNEYTFQWACDACIISEKAILAQPISQTNCDTPPYLAFFDKTLYCKQCKQDFVFSAIKQHFFYETMKFWVQGQPNFCPNCKKAIHENQNATNRLTSELSHLLQNKKEINRKQAERISIIYGLLGKVDKQRFYEKLAQKLSIDEF